MRDNEEGMVFSGIFREQFAPAERVQNRLRDERLAGQTLAQRNRPKAPPKKQINFRATRETELLIQQLARHLGTTATDVLTRGVAALADSLPDFERQA